MTTNIDGIEVLRNAIKACDLLAHDQVIGVDLETTGLSPWKDNIALIQLYGEDTSTLAVVQVFDNIVPQPIVDLLESGKTFVVHNGVGFDLLFLHMAGVRWRRSIWYDSLVAESILASTNRRDVSKSLRESLRRRLGKTINKDIDHGQWSNPVLTDRQLQYAAQDVISLPALRRVQLQKAKETRQLEAFDMEMALVPIVAQMTINGLPCVESRVVQYVEDQRKASLESAAFLKDKLGDINLNSPIQLRKKLNEIGIKVDSTAVATLAPIARFGGPTGELINHILNWRHCAQRIKMYRPVWRNKYIVDSYVHPHFWQVGTSTTRFSCSNPNLQQIPKDGRHIIGGLPGLSVVSVDYSQIEVRMAAFLAKDKILIERLESEDTHRAIAAEIFNIDEKKVTAKQRKLAKAATFTLLFGGGAQTIYNYAEMSGGSMTQEQATNLVYRFFNTFTGLRMMRQRATKLAKKSGPVFIRLPNSCRRILVGYNKKSTTILNTMIQGAAAVGIKYGMLEVGRQGLDKYLGGQVHDELLSTVPTNEAKEYGKELQTAMIVGMHKVLPTKVIAEIKIGNVWQA